MANTSITPTKVNDVNVLSAGLDLASVSAVADKFVIDCEGGADNKTIFVVKNANAAAKELTIAKGNGIQGVNDLVMSVPAGKHAFFQVDSGAYVNATGDDAGKLIASVDSTDITLAVLQVR